MTSEHHGYADEPEDLPVGSPYWFVQGQYGYWIVEERQVGTTGAKDGGIRGLSKRNAMAIAGALNEGYRRGLHDRTHVPTEPWAPCRDRSTCPGWEIVS